MRLSRTLMAANKFTKYSISALPLAPPSQLLTHNLTPDPRTPSVAAFRDEVLTTSPSLQRRARLLAPEAHFSYVTPLPVPFPYDIEPPSPSDAPPDSPSYIEKWLAAREPRIAQPPTSPNASLCKYTAEVRDNVGDAKLIGLAESALRDCIPHLEVGDAFALLGAPALAVDDNEEVTEGTQPAAAARTDLIDVLSGRAVLMSDSFAPWAVRYSGHQFGTWAGQLGDGRATSILATPHPASGDDLTYELQLKGAGRTPFSRSADGLAVTRSSVREYLCSEAMHALGIPTTRALALVSLPGVPVLRETVENACVLTRLAPSFIRIGSFEALSPPQNTFLFGGGQQAAHWDALRALGLWVSESVLRLPKAVTPEDSERSTVEGEAKEAHPAPWGKDLVLEVARRNARMVAGWQAYGFMHGVINTDNVSILGLTIDYGPYAFMDVFDPYHICNHTDEEGRYAYRSQPTNILFAIRALHAALAPLIGAELSFGHAVPVGWADTASKEELAAWRARGMDELKDELERVTQGETAAAYAELMRKRLALRRAEPTDETTLVRPLLDLMATHKLDFHGTFRVLTAFRPGMLPASESKLDSADNSGTELDALIARLLAQAPGAERVDRTRATEDWRTWLNVYARRVEREADQWTSTEGAAEGMDVQRTRMARAANPRFVLRQWVLQEVIAAVEKDAVRGRRVLAKVLHMACNPFEPWGGEDADPDDEAQLDAEEREERRFCGPGDSRMLGFQCSCSS
ncbi:hypothetical protein FB451DRAFT_1244693 [Mycena latifolia]|nr:hypothetical protein FB451DRAFT_1244693 [Mycena latifolia]